MSVPFNPAARVEADDVVDYIAARSPVRAVRFQQALADLLSAAAATPRFFPPAGVEAREALVGRFSFRVIHVVEADGPRVVAVARTHRQSGHWHPRLSYP